MYLKKIYLVIVALAYFVLQPTVLLADCKVLSQKSSVYQGLMPMVIKWKDALLTKDFHKLAIFAIPDQQKYVLSDLKNTKSDFYRLLYEEKDSIYKFLKRAKKLKIVLVECFKEEWANSFPGPRVQVYYYDETEINLQFPPSLKHEELSEKYTEWSKKGYVFVHHWGKEEGKWYTNYNLLPEDANNKNSKSKD